jgi:hypothetical protein
MKAQLKKLAVPLLQWVVGLVVLAESLRLAFGPEAGRHFARTGMPAWLRPALAWPEIVAALLFLIPLTVVAGGYFLLVVFAFAAVLHLLHGQYDIGALLVYAMAVLVVIADRSSALPEVAGDRP